MLYPPPRIFRRLYHGAIGMVLLCMVQILLGVWMMLYYKLPRHHPGAGDSNYLGATAQIFRWISENTYWTLSAHVVVGLLMFLVAIWVAVIVGKGRDLVSTLFSILGVSSIFAAGLLGLTFLVTSQNSAAFEMGIAFVLVISTYFAMAVRAKGRVAR